MEKDEQQDNNAKKNNQLAIRSQSLELNDNYSYVDHSKNIQNPFNGKSYYNFNQSKVLKTLFRKMPPKLISQLLKFKQNIQLQQEQQIICIKNKQIEFKQTNQFKQNNESIQQQSINNNKENLKYQQEDKLIFKNQSHLINFLNQQISKEQQDVQPVTDINSSNKSIQAQKYKNNEQEVDDENENENEDQRQIQKSNKKVIDLNQLKRLNQKNQQSSHLQNKSQNMSQISLEISKNNSPQNNDIKDIIQYDNKEKQAGKSKKIFYYSISNQIKSHSSSPNSYQNIGFNISLVNQEQKTLENQQNLQILQQQVNEMRRIQKSKKKQKNIKNQNKQKCEPNKINEDFYLGAWQNSLELDQSSTIGDWFNR
ncbi:hypothetical protein PPERSA_11212 [Pseudocohnilembus persalinus]|uniref:Uncharacterized protein n=1 Tax=Pseudocohnilembus persalinus TaxID=266149 RepID=A0A0V0QZB2_PSEPJ|nr:hypothetical protein PPERSA_11212 [Pseudocohnilembus persalinus]|eukprot:KRX07663.1 hypothetical protein PPERSA_11212 [Pseudocohnilembus persalinus]